MRVLTKRFGVLKVPHEDIWEFPVPLAGFSHSRRYTIIEDERIRPFLWLQSLDEPEVAFVIIETSLVSPAYAPSLPEGELSCLQCSPG
ncbi:MAG TPA: flagellar assembly protein FliW, partial [Firmicutes bacterium]|nr:flagellar assembly protein FliW [Bacillota bacterium]